MSYTLGDAVKKFGLSGGHSLRVYNVSPDGATGDITVSDVDEVYVIGVVPLSQDSVGSNSQVAVQALQDSSTKNKVNIKLWKATHSAASGGYTDFLLILICVH